MRRKKRETKGRVIHIRDETLHEKVKRFCEKNKCSMTEFTEEMLKLGMDAHRRA